MSQESFFSHTDSIDLDQTTDLLESFDLKKTRCNYFISNKNKDNNQIDL